MRAAWAMLARDPASSAGTGVLGAIQTAAASIGVDVRPIGSDDTTAIERGVAAFASRANGGLVVPATALASLHRELIIELATRYRLRVDYGRRLGQQSIIDNHPGAASIRRVDRLCDLEQS
jgi:hypothetical protein